MHRVEQRFLLTILKHRMLDRFSRHPQMNTCSILVMSKFGKKNLFEDDVRSIHSIGLLLNSVNQFVFSILKSLILNSFQVFQKHSEFRLRTGRTSLSLSPSLKSIFVDIQPKIGIVIIWARSMLRSIERSKVFKQPNRQPI